MAAYLARTLGANGDQKTWTLSWWAKFGDQANTYGGGMVTCSDGATGSTYFTIYPSSSASWGKFDFYNDPGGTKNFFTTARYRDPAAWYHFTVMYDTTQSLEADRVKIYVNGEQVTDFDTAQYPAEDYATGGVGRNGYKMTLGAYNAGSSSDWDYEGYLAHFHYCDGFAYAASDFGQTDSTSGIWVPKLAPSVSYGDEGCFLKFKNEGTSAATGNVGEDYSGNDNHFSAANMGTNYVTTDTPQNNFCTGNPLSNFYEQAVYTKGNLKVQSDTAGSSNAYTAMSANTALKAGKWYWEMYIDNEAAEISTGITPYITSSDTQWVGAQLYSYGYYTNGVLYNNSSSTAFGDSYTTGDTISFGVDLTNSKLYIAKNGVWQNSGDPAAGTNGFAIASVATVAASTSTSYGNVGYQPSWSEQTSHTNSTISWNFGNPVYAITSSNADDAGYGNFEYDVPAGFYAVCTQNLATYG